ncbi:MAG: oxidoreductase [Candidatus Scalindua rubra]|uniref:Oxidoreductase n=1 Tax=Candidatus Scalindua rubra TaxID=1872076 RepID=A0A1E3XG07_9BACT|nr:MAG: oxidoreductase [Candidatus Scalindua rubra]
MKVLLLEPNLSLEDRYGKALGKVGPTSEPLSLAYLAGAIKREGIDYVSILDAAALKLNQSQIETYLINYEPEVVGVRIVTPMYIIAKKTIATVRKTVPTAKIIVGGPHVSIFPKETMLENPMIDMGVVGEGEITIIELLDALRNNNPLDKIDGIVYRKGGTVRITSPRSYLKDIDKAPLPARELLPMDKYIPNPTYYKKLPCYILLTSRGCPFSCTYCCKTFGDTYRYHSSERVLEEINILIKDYNAREILFRDDSFTLNKKRITDLCEKMIKDNLHRKIQWACSTRVDIVSKPLLKLMKKAGCWSIHYGVESGSQRLLDVIDKKITLQQVRDAVEWTKEVGIEAKAYFMIGLPTETYKETLKTVKFAKEIDPDGAQFTITVPYPGTRLFELARKNGTLKSFKWENYQTWGSWSNKELVYLPEGRTEEEIKFLQKKALRDFYFRPKIIVRQLAGLRSFSIFKKQLFAAYSIIQGTTR